jgi:putative membrane protein
MGMPSALSRTFAVLFNAVRGALIGIAEIIPGVSGGTIALIVGVYRTLIDSAGHLVRGVVCLVADGIRRRGQARSREHFAEVQWSVILPIIIGMFAAVFLGAALLAPLIEEHPELARALFAGLIATSLIVPIRMVGGRWRPIEWIGAIVAAGLAFGFSSIPTADPANPPLILVAVAAAFAVCALVLPGVSGSFLLLIFGMYAPTLDAVNDRDLVYLGTFVVGAIIGLSLFVSGLQWLLDHRGRITLAIMTGLMVGSLRALWPWQSEDGDVLAPGDVTAAVIAFSIGVAIVAVLLLVESMLVRRRSVEGTDVLNPSSAEVESDDLR